jgi:hypothetical protein
LSKSLYGAELMDVGTWPAQTGTVTVTSATFDALVSSFDALNLSRKVPLKLGHNDRQPVTDGQPALGWVSRLWRDGTKLMADFVDVPDVIFEAIRKKLYKTVSIEAARDVQAGTRKLPWVLEAVALLGADQPAIGTLDDLQALLTARKPVFQARARVALTRDTKFFFTGAQKGMDEKDVQAAIATALAEQATKLTAQFSKQLTDEVTKVTAAAKAESDAAVAKAKAESHRTQIKAKFETAVKAEALLPAKRESFFKYNRVDDDVAVVQIKLEDVDAYIVEFSDAAKLAAANKTQTKTGDKVEFAATAALEVTRRMEERILKTGGKLTDYAANRAATKYVLSADPKLAKAYFADPNGAFQGEAA